ncbi:glycosyltransferase [Belliella kenyensis]|uniref:Glycosyltransferase n=1 Tax=Belliella kenyensis TaxID=1472724 RepID=A0ABV8EL23_9BACT|nr:glycosyltransferase [Belliella kenyensis]MCH7402642.1 glycosyltransferase [Belliella kenyensis]MDN3603810.1 glycosyltransferase [Belliella kenyensis]
MKSPKVLIINQPFDNVTGGGITLSNLFKDYPKEKLAVVCSGYLINENTNFEACSKYYQIGHKEHRWKFPFNLFKRKYFSGEVQKPKAIVDQTPSDKPNLKSSLRLSFINKVFYPTLEFLGLYHNSSIQELSPELCAWLDEFSPDILYAQASSRNSILFCIQVQYYLDKPLVFHMMDDWASMVKTEGIFGKYWFRRIEKDFQTLFEKSSVLLSISDLMAKEYKERYKKEFFTFHNPIDVEFWNKNRKSKSKLESPAILLYAGRVGTGIDSSLQEVAAAIEIVNETTDYEIQFALQTAEAPKWIRNYSHTKHNPYVEYDELPRIFSEADFLILPYDFDEKGLSFIRLSMPTKASEYLASGTPVIVFSPKSTAVVDYVEKHQCGMTVLENDAEILASKIKELMDNDQMRLDLVKRGVEVAEKYHSQDEVSKRFQELISSLN